MPMNSCLHLSVAGITGMRHNPLFMQWWGWNQVFLHARQTLYQPNPILAWEGKRIERIIEFGCDVRLDYLKYLAKMRSLSPLVSFV